MCEEKWEMGKGMICTARQWSLRGGGRSWLVGQVMADLERH